jgi:hypothetical protein
MIASIVEAAFLCRFCDLLKSSLWRKPTYRWPLIPPAADKASADFPYRHDGVSGLLLPLQALSNTASDLAEIALNEE